MAYAAMNVTLRFKEVSSGFLNGVCRHELAEGEIEGLANFLNGVCRHEL